MAYQPSPQPLVSTANSTSSVLAAAGVFTGTSEDISPYSVVTVSGKASHASATDGLSIQQSHDGTNWDITDTYTTAANVAFNFGVQISAKFYRVVYTNGATLQTSFRLQSIFHTNGNPDSSQRPSDGRTNETDTQENSSFLMGYNGTTWDRIRTKGTGVISNDVTTINNVTPLMGNGVTGTGSQRVTIASDNSAFPISQITTSIVPGVAATNLGKAEDAAHASGDTGVAVWGVRNDNAATALTSANGDYSPIAVDSTGTNFYREAPANTATKSNVAGATASTTILAANAARRSAVVFNDSTANLYLSYGGTASSTSFTVLLGTLESTTIDGSEYAGALVGIWTAATGSARVTEIV